MLDLLIFDLITLLSIKIVFWLILMAILKFKISPLKTDSVFKHLIQIQNILKHFKDLSNYHINRVFLVLFNKIMFMNFVCLGITVYILVLVKLRGLQ